MANKSKNKVKKNSNQIDKVIKNIKKDILEAIYNHRRNKRFRSSNKNGLSPKLIICILIVLTLLFSRIGLLAIVILAILILLLRYL